MTTTTAPQVALAPARTGRTYIAGPMTGLPDFNYPAFNAAAAALRAQGVDAINPADHGIVPGATWEDYLRADLVQLATCEAVYFLPGWSKSRGALLEHHVAAALGMRLEYADGAERGAPMPSVDPWRGLYSPEALPARDAEYGSTCHPDLPFWPDDREESIEPLVNDQGFEIVAVTGEFSEAAMETGDERYWAEMAEWNPEPPAGDGWRLAWLGDTEDGPAAWFVRPVAMGLTDAHAGLRHA